MIPNSPHHITQRGDNRRDVFFSDRDRELYLTLLKEYSQQYKLDILGYCLMPNHVHVVPTPTTEQSLAKVFGRTHNDYARSLNIRRRESGHLWQNRFHSCPVQSCYLGAVRAYVESSEIW